MPYAHCQLVDAVTLKGWLHDREEIALFDIREEGLYGEGHPFYAVPLPYSRFELNIGRLAPCLATRIVLFDDGDGVAPRAASSATALGYSNVFVLDGGAPAWSAAGFTLFAGVNVPSKAFGELAEHYYGTPRVSAAELVSMQKNTVPPVVLDGRPFAEYKKMNIPGAICCPNGDLAYRLRDIVPDTTTPIVINCAGRTRSIIGAQTLINIGVPNPVYALENGTQGWYLNDFELEHGNTRRYPEQSDPKGHAEARRGAQALAQRHAVARVSVAEAAALLADRTRSTFLCDVRSPEEYAAASIPGSQSTPGGQLVQATDQYVGVRRARLLLLDDDGIRAPVVASWLCQMGHEAMVLDGGLDAARNAGLTACKEGLTLAPAMTLVSPDKALELYESREAVFLDVRSSTEYRAAHILDSIWSIRPVFALDLAEVSHDAILILVGAENVAGLAAAELSELGYEHMVLLEGGVQGWEAAGYALARHAHNLPDERCIDFIFFVHDRHSGNKEAARRYLAWETNLIAQLDEQELATFKFPASKAD